MSESTYIKTREGIVMRITDDNRDRRGNGTVLATPAYKSDKIRLDSSDFTTVKNPHELTIRQKIGFLTLTVLFSASGVAQGLDLSSTYHVPVLMAGVQSFLCAIVGVTLFSRVCGLIKI